jgi:membrane-associated phospholipid phosphatase
MISERFAGDGSVLVWPQRSRWLGPLLALAFAIPAAAAPAFAQPILSRPHSAQDRNAGQWRTLVLERADQFRPAPPVSRESEIGQVVSRQERRTPEWKERVQYWHQGAITHRWTELLLQKIAKYGLNPVRASQAIGFLHVAMYDATVACWDAKLAYGLASPSTFDRKRIIPLVYTPPDLPSFPSEHAAVAAAAATVLSEIFPGDASLFQALANEARDSRLWAGVNFPSDVYAGQTLGRQVGAAVLARGEPDRVAEPFLGTMPVGPQYWFPIPGARLLEPEAGNWQTWILASAGQVAPGAPLTFGSPEYAAEVGRIVRTSEMLSNEQKAIADFWADGPSTMTPPGHWMQIASAIVDQRLRHEAPRAARALALVGIALADSFVSCWHTKYTYWTARPNQVIPNFEPYLRTPPFPGYTSGHATQSAAAAEVLAYLFPDLADEVRAMAREAADSRLYGGIHFPNDNERGSSVGRRIGALVVEYAKRDGAEGVRKGQRQEIRMP